MNLYSSSYECGSFSNMLKGDCLGKLFCMSILVSFCKGTVQTQHLKEKYRDYMKGNRILKKNSFNNSYINRYIFQCNKKYAYPSKST